MVLVIWLILYCWSDSVTALVSNDKRLVSGKRDEDPPTKCRYISWLFPIRTGLLDLLMPSCIDRSLRDDHDIYDGLIQTIDCAEVFSRGTYNELTDNLSNPYIMSITTDHEQRWRHQQIKQNPPGCGFNGYPPKPKKDQRAMGT